MSGSEKVSRDVTFDAAQVISKDHALVPSVMKLNEERVARGFWPKIARVVAHIPFARDALSVWYCAKDDDTPIAAKGMMLAALAYFVLPFDFMPDVLPIVGITDDAAVLAGALRLVWTHLLPEHRDAARDAVDRMKAQD